MYNENITIKKIYEESLAISKGEGLVAPFGIKENGGIEYVDYSKINHLIVCGTSGSGKTTFVRTLLTSLMSVSSPDSVNFCIFDSKRIDYADLNGMPFLLVPVVTDSKKCAGIISWVYIEAKKREILLSEDTKNIDTFTDIFVVLDDYAEIDQEQKTQEHLYELLQIAHRVKIHVIIVTSIALAKIISTELKVNIPHRVSFFLPERRNSQVVIDQDGAETLDFPGEFIAKFYSKTKTLRSIELSDLEVKEFFDLAKSYNGECDNPLYNQIFSKWGIETNYDEHLMSEIERQSRISKNVFSFEEPDVFSDPLYDTAVQVVVEAGAASTSLLQRELRIGYHRAEHIINEMETQGVVGPHNGAKPREVLINK